MPKNRVRFSTKGAACHQSTQSFPKNSHALSTSRIVLRSSMCASMKITKPIRAWSPGALRRCAASVSEWAAEVAGGAAVVIDKDGESVAEGVVDLCVLKISSTLMRRRNWLS